MRFEFGKATDITEFAIKNFDETCEGYEKVFICPDSRDYHILRILEGYNEDYNECEGLWLLEIVDIPKERSHMLSSLSELKEILGCDDGGSDDVIEYRSMDRIIEVVDGGFGINKL